MNFPKGETFCRFKWMALATGAKIGEGCLSSGCISIKYLFNITIYEIWLIKSYCSCKLILQFILVRLDYTPRKSGRILREILVQSFIDLFIGGLVMKNFEYNLTYIKLERHQLEAFLQSLFFIERLADTHLSHVYITCGLLFLYILVPYCKVSASRVNLCN